MPERYGIEIGPEAKEDIDEVLGWLGEKLPHFAEHWFNGLEAAIQTLGRFPARCPLAPENSSPDYEHELRQLLYGERRNQYRILFWIDGDLVRIFRIRHSARRWLHEGDE